MLGVEAKLTTQTIFIMAHKVTYDWYLIMRLLYILIIITSSPNFLTISFAATDAEILLNFKKSLSTQNPLLNNWNDSAGIPCNGNKSWYGVRCNSDGTIDKLILENLALTGTIDMDTLMNLPTLRTLSFMYNSFTGPMPQVKKLSSLRNLYLSNNSFSGKINEDAFDGMNSLRALYMAHNQFTGEIPRSLSVSVPKLKELRLEGNQLGGQIPDFPQENLTLLNLADNHFQGQIPASLAHFGSSSFAGNEGLCGKPLLACKSSKKKTIIIIVIVVAAVVGLSAIVAFAFIRSRRTKTHEAKARKESPKTNGTSPKETSQSSEQLGNSKKVEQLHFVSLNRDRFDLQDLLRASAEVLGSGTFGSSYKAVLFDGPAMVVKRFRHMSNVGKEEFHEHARRLGALSHPNLLPLVAYYYRREEKLLVSDFIDNGSLACHLHGKRAAGKPWLDWPTRLKIVKGVARGLAYLYKEFPTLALPHGHLKSSNVLVDDTFQPLLTDYALVPVVNKDHAQQVMVGYKSPEYTQSDRTTRKTDVWSLGILILEILTGKFPADYLRQGNGANADLATWVNSVVREEWTGEVFDMDMMRTKNCEGEMLKLLKIGMCCCEWNMERRWDLTEAVARIEELKEKDNDNEGFSSYASEGEIYSSRAMTDDDFSFSVNGS